MKVAYMVSLTIFLAGQLSYDDIQRLASEKRRLEDRANKYKQMEDLITQGNAQNEKDAITVSLSPFRICDL